MRWVGIWFVILTVVRAVFVVNDTEGIFTYDGDGNVIPQPIYSAANMRDIGMPVVPKLILVGAQKCGTTSLWVFLMVRMRSLVQPRYVSDETRNETKIVKELHFFDKWWDAGTEWYLKHYIARTSADQVSVDMTPGYFRNALVPERMVQVLGTSAPRFMLLLRDPAKRGYSWYNHIMRSVLFNKYESYYQQFDFNWKSMANTTVPLLKSCVQEYAPEEVFLQCSKDADRWQGEFPIEAGGRVTDDLSHIVEMFSDGLYGNILLQWYKFYSPDQFCILFFEHLVEDFSREMKKLRPCFEGVGVELEMPENAHLPLFNTGACQDCTILSKTEKMYFYKFLDDSLYARGNQLLRDLLESKHGINPSTLPPWELGRREAVQ